MLLVIRCESRVGRDAAAAGYDAGGELYASSTVAEAAAGVAEKARRGGAEARWAVDAELSRLDAESAAAEGWTEAVPCLQPPIEAGRLTAWLRTLPAEEVGHVTTVSQIVGGFSKDTWLVEISGKLAGHSQLVLRRDLPFGPGENCVSDERDLLTKLYAAGVPVPLPRAGDDDPDVVGVPFLIFPRLSGRAVFGDWDAPDAERKAVIADTAACMARYHALDLGSLGLTEQPRAEAVADMVALWRGKWEKRRLYPSAISSPRRSLAANGRRVWPARLVMAMSSSDKTLFQEGAVGLLACEFAHPGIGGISYLTRAEAYVTGKSSQPTEPVRAICPAREIYESRSTLNARLTATASRLVRGLYPRARRPIGGSLYRSSCATSPQLKTYIARPFSTRLDASGTCRAETPSTATLDELSSGPEARTLMDRTYIGGTAPAHELCANVYLVIIRAA